MSPTLTILPGDSMTADDAEQYRAAWFEVAAGVERALTELDSDHPRRHRLVELLRNARRCAGLPLVQPAQPETRGVS